MRSVGEQEPHSQRPVGRAIAELQLGWLDVGGARRTFLLAPAPQPEAPLLIVLHGLGISGKDMDTFTGLARRGPAAEFATVFPDACDQMWDDGRQRGRHRDTDDFGFMEALVDRLVSDRVADPGALFLVGLSNGALFAERLARHGILPVTGIVLVAGTTTETTRREAPRPARPAAVLCFEGTADPFMPYAGGSRQHNGLLGRLVAWRAGWRPGDPPREGTVAVDMIASDWVEVNGLPLAPSVEAVSNPDGDLPVTRFSWSAPGRRPVVLYRVEGGGHTWPGGPQQMPSRLIGPVARRLDATGILLEMARHEILSGSSDGS
jgi:polyhydroxybutyrate depolymerase